MTSPCLFSRERTFSHFFFSFPNSGYAGQTPSLPPAGGEREEPVCIASRYTGIINRARVRNRFRGRGRRRRERTRDDIPRGSGGDRPCLHLLSFGFIFVPCARSRDTSLSLTHTGGRRAEYMCTNDERELGCSRARVARLPGILVV